MCCIPKLKSIPLHLLLRNFFAFLEQEEDTRFTMALGMAGSTIEINLWQAVEIAPSASKMVSFSYYSKKQKQLKVNLMNPHHY